MGSWADYQKRCLAADLRLAKTPPKHGWAAPKTPKPPVRRKVTEEEKEANRLRYMHEYRERNRLKIREYNREYQRKRRSKSK